MYQGRIFKHDGQNGHVFVSLPQFLGRVGFGMIGFRGDLYMIGGCLEPPDCRNLSDVHVLTLSSENPAWFSVALMSPGCGTVLGCAEF